MEHRQPKAPATQVLREKLRGVLTEQQIDELCFDYFRPIYDAFTRGMTKDEKVQLLIEYCDRECRLDELDRRIDVYRQPPARGPAPGRPQPTAGVQRGPTVVWLAVIALAILAGVVAALFVLALWFPRGPIPSTTPVALATATYAHPTPTPLPSAIPTATPTPPSTVPPAVGGAPTPKPHFSDLAFCTGGGFNEPLRCCVQTPTPYFVGDVDTIYVSWRYENVYQDMKFSRYWYQDGRLVYTKSSEWDGIKWRFDLGHEYTYLDAGAIHQRFFPSGKYWLKIYIENELALEGGFEVRQ